jgi:hypothetical protein
MAKQSTHKIAVAKKTANTPTNNSPLDLPAHPPRAKVSLFIASLALFLLWFAYLVCVARWG